MYRQGGSPLLAMVFLIRRVSFQLHDWKFGHSVIWKILYNIVSSSFYEIEYLEFEFWLMKTPYYPPFLKECTID